MLAPRGGAEAPVGLDPDSSQRLGGEKVVNLEIGWSKTLLTAIPQEGVERQTVRFNTVGPPLAATGIELYQLSGTQGSGTWL